MTEDVSIVKWEVAEGVGTLTLNRPGRRNALSSALVEAVIARLREAREAPAVRCVVITGAGERAFCAGGDLADGMAGGGGGLPSQLADKGRFVELVLCLRDLGKPTVARLNGDALGGGVGLMLACDLVVAAEDARIGLPEIKVGLWPMMVTALLVRHVGRKLASEMMLLGQRYGAPRAREMGLINRVVGRAGLDAEVSSVAGALASRSSAVLRLGLQALHQTADLPLEPALWALRDRLALNALLDDAAEGVMAFVGKRPPVWRDR